ncbi:MAG: thermonuclease family protein [Clostridiales bacterium]|nr:thermonuclease family protein [Clostridiales bacterium]
MKKLISITLAVLLVISACCVLTACGVADNTEHFDSITRTLKLDKAYENKSWFTDGIGVVTVKRYIDGDTTNFQLANGASFTVRYYQINTPESTGMVEPWGKAASLFVKQQLSGADLIVLEGTNGVGQAPGKDSNGSRYLAYVWYRTRGEKDLKCLNLELVENGFSPNNGTEDPTYPYFSYFAKAQAFAQKKQVRLYSELADPLYRDVVVPITLKEMWSRLKAIEAAGENSTDDLFYTELGTGALIQFDAYLESLTVTGTFMFKATQYDPDTGERYSVNVYAAYSSNKASEMKVGDYYKIVGNIQFYEATGEYQITSIDYDPVNDGEKKTTTKGSNYYLIFDSTVGSEVYRSNYNKNVYRDMTVTWVGDVVDGYLTFKGESCRINGKNSYDENDVREFVCKVKVPDNYTGIQVGSVLRFGGVHKLVDNVRNITVIDLNDIFKVK